MSDPSSAAWADALTRLAAIRRRLVLAELGRRLLWAAAASAASASALLGLAHAQPAWALPLTWIATAVAALTSGWALAGVRRAPALLEVAWRCDQALGLPELIATATEADDPFGALLRGASAPRLAALAPARVAPLGWRVAGSWAAAAVVALGGCWIGLGWPRTAVDAASEVRRDVARGVRQTADAVAALPDASDVAHQLARLARRLEQTTAPAEARRDGEAALGELQQRLARAREARQALDAIRRSPTLGKLADAAGRPAPADERAAALQGLTGERGGAGRQAAARRLKALARRTPDRARAAELTRIAGLLGDPAGAREGVRRLQQLMRQLGADAAPRDALAMAASRLEQSVRRLGGQPPPAPHGDAADPRGPLARGPGATPVVREEPPPPATTVPPAQVVAPEAVELLAEQRVWPAEEDTLVRRYLSARDARAR